VYHVYHAFFMDARYLVCSAQDWNIGGDMGYVGELRIFRKEFSYGLADGFGSSRYYVRSPEVLFLSRVAQMTNLNKDGRHVSPLEDQQGGLANPPALRV